MNSIDDVLKVYDQRANTNVSPLSWSATDSKKAWKKLDSKRQLYIQRILKENYDVIESTHLTVKILEGRCDKILMIINLLFFGFFE